MSDRIAQIYLLPAVNTLVIKIGGNKNDGGPNANSPNQQ
jgi:hypothetical protein